MIYEKKLTEIEKQWQVFCDMHGIKRREIEFILEDYCQNCREFDPIIKELITYGECSHLIICRNSIRCEAIHKKAKEDLKQAAEEE